MQKYKGGKNRAPDDSAPSADDDRAGAKPKLKRKEYEASVEVVIQTIAPGWDPLLPAGGQRLWCFDAEHGLPVLIVTHDEASREVEYYCHDRFEFPAPYTDDDFNPERRWSKNKSRRGINGVVFR